MIISSVSYQVGVARIDDLRLEADARRRAKLVNHQSDLARSISSRSRREQLGRTLNALRPHRAARA